MDNDGLSDLREADSDNISELSEADDGIPEATFCKICAPIFSENSYERWSKFWQIWDQIHDGPVNLYSLPYPGLHHQSWESIEDSMEQGCYICSRFDSVKHFSFRNPFPLKYHLRVLSEDEEQLTGAYKLHIATRDDFLRALFYIRPGYPSVTIQQLANQSRCRIWTGHEDVARLAKRWVIECLTKHESCFKPSLDGWKPSRLLDISKDKIKLVPGISAEVQQHHYATLSHCWGTRKFSVLTVENERSYVEGVDISEFQPTFRETITTIRRLGLRYLWIDCYCIIQGDDAEASADWKIESLRMGKIYANSLLNIGVLESAGPAEGLFRNRPFSALNSRILWSPTQQDGRQIFHLTGRRPSVLEIRAAFKKMNESPLMKRGWVVQECVLAPRMLSFGQSGVLWQCSEQIGSEVGGYDIGPVRDRLWDFPFWLLENTATDYQPRAYDLRRQWLGTLTIYGKSHLTYPEKDLFAALDGIGAELSKISGGSFKYGMWDTTFPEALLYESYDHDMLSTRNKARPTWHWSSCYPKVSHHDLELIYSDKHKYKTQVFRLAYAFMSGDCKPLPNECSKDFWPNLLLIGRLMTALPPVVKVRWDKVKFDTVEDEGASSSHTMSYLPIIIITDDGPGTGSMCYGLILVQSESGAYRRVGYWSRDIEDTRDFGNKVIKIRPRLIILE
ncbi:heterokaryon incompatibility protein-domain-containing protein [Xylaria acuta]|nr:heterokaryon incompatibility protein-domain-containing protein [Xylaria acuta]